MTMLINKTVFKNYMKTIFEEMDLKRRKWGLTKTKAASENIKPEHIFVLGSVYDERLAIKLAILTEKYHKSMSVQDGTESSILPKNTANELILNYLVNSAQDISINKIAMRDPRSVIYIDYR